MFGTREEIESELTHKHNLLRSFRKNLQITETQISKFAPAEVRLGLYRQRDDIESQITETLRGIELLEKELGGATHKQVQIVVHHLLPSLPPGMIHLYNKENDPLLKYDMSNYGDKSLSVIVSSQIEDFSFRCNDTIRLAPGENATVLQLPVIKPEAIKNLYEVRQVVLHTRASCLCGDKESLLFMQDYNIQMLARDVIIWAIVLEPHFVRDLSYQIAAWVTPNARPVVELVGQATEYAQSRSFVGYVNSGSYKHRAEIVRGQVKAIFHVLKERTKITYVDSRISFGCRSQGVQQRVNLPGDSITYHHANCIDGTVLYASLFERISLNPVIVLVPGHAFVGWEAVEGTRKYEFLETTMTNNYTFEDAYNSGMDQFGKAQSLIGNSLFDPNGFIVLHNIRDLRGKGIIPME